jgi:hypothetical protein
MSIRPRHLGVPEPRAKRTLDCGDRVAAPRRNLPHSVLLLEREPRRERAEPLTRTSESLAPVSDGRSRMDAVEQFERMPSEAALAIGDRGAEPLDTVRLHKLVRVLGGRKQLGLDDEDARAPSGAAGGGDGTAGRRAAGAIAVEAQRHGLDSRSVETLEQSRRQGRPTKGDDVLDSAGAKLMDVQKPLDDEQLAAGRRWPSREIGPPVGRQLAPLSSAQVEVLGRRSRSGRRRTGPQRSHAPPLVAPRAAEPPAPPRVAEYPAAARARAAATLSGTSPIPDASIASLGSPRSTRYSRAVRPRSLASSRRHSSANAPSRSAPRSRWIGRSMPVVSTPARSAISLTARTKSAPRGGTPPLTYAVQSIASPP